MEGQRLGLYLRGPSRVRRGSSVLARRAEEPRRIVGAGSRRLANVHSQLPGAGQAVRVRTVLLRLRVAGDQGQRTLSQGARRREWSARTLADDAEEPATDAASDGMDLRLRD